MEWKIEANIRRWESTAPRKKGSFLQTSHLFRRYYAPSSRGRGDGKLLVNFLFKALLLKRNENKNIFILCKVKSSKKPFPARVFRFIDNFVREISTIVESKSIEENMILQKREKNIVNFTMVNVVLISGAAAAPSTSEKMKINIILQMKLNYNCLARFWSGKLSWERKAASLKVDPELCIAFRTT